MVTRQWEVDSQEWCATTKLLFYIYCTVYIVVSLIKCTGDEDTVQFGCQWHIADILALACSGHIGN